MKLEFIEARDVPDAWFQCIYRLLETGREYTIDRGSYKGQKRLEFDHVTIHIKYPATRPLLPDIPPALGIPNPVAEGYLEQYLPSLMTSDKQPGEDYTYGQYQDQHNLEIVLRSLYCAAWPAPGAKPGMPKFPASWPPGWRCLWQKRRRGWPGSRIRGLRRRVRDHCNYVIATGIMRPYTRLLWVADTLTLRK